MKYSTQTFLATNKKIMDIQGWIINNPVTFEKINSNFERHLCKNLLIVILINVLG